MGADRRKMKKLKKAKQAAPREHLFPSEYEWHVHLAAKGMAERDTYPMPKSVTTAEGFYEIMAGAALEATGLRALLGRAVQAERELELLREELQLGDAKAAMGRHVAQGRHAPRSRPPAAPAAAALATERARTPVGASIPTSSGPVDPSPPSVSPPSSPSMPGSPTPNAVPAGRRAKRPASSAREPTVTLRIPVLAKGGLRGLANMRHVGRVGHTLLALPHGLWVWTRKVVLRRPDRVACPQCGARHPTTYGGEPCLICQSKLPSDLSRPDDGSVLTPSNLLPA